MNITKRYTEEGSDGSTELFSLPDNYVSESIWCYVVDEEGVSKLVGIEEVGGSFYRVTPAPELTSTLMLIYEVEEEEDLIESYGLTPWNESTMLKILTLVKAQSESIEKMDKALDNRVSQENFEGWATLLEKELEDVKSRII